MADDEDDEFIKYMREVIVSSLDDDDEEEEDEDEEEILVDGLDDEEIEEAIKEEIAELEKRDVDDYYAVLPIDIEIAFVYKNRRGMSTRFGYTQEFKTFLYTKK